MDGLGGSYGVERITLQDASADGAAGDDYWEYPMADNSWERRDGRVSGGHSRLDARLAGWTMRSPH